MKSWIPVALIYSSVFVSLFACGSPAREETGLGESPPQSPSGLTQTTGPADWRHEGYLVVANQADATAELIDLKAGKSLKKIPTGIGPHEAAISDDGRLAAITNYGSGPNPGNSLTIAAIPSGEVVKTISLGEYTRPHGIAWLDGDRVLVTSETTRNVVQVNVAEGKVEKAFPTGNPGSHMLALDRAGKRVYTANIPAANVTAIDLRTGQKIGDVPTAQASEGIALSPDGKWIVTGNRSGSISIIEAKAMKKVKDIPCEGVPYRAGFTPDGKRALIPCPMSKELVVVDMAKLEIEKRIKTSTEPGNPQAPLAGPRGVAVHPNGKWAYLTLNESLSAGIVDLEKLELAGQVGVGASPDGIAFTIGPK
jgi:DNA-binding beta-propeller fold protein YncE